MRNPLRLGVLLFLSICATSGWSQESKPVPVANIEILWAGIFEGSSHSPRLIERTNRIPARQGYRFGVRLVTHAPAVLMMTFTHVTRYPPPGRRVPGRDTPIKGVQSTTDCLRDIPCLIGYAIDDADEVIPGTWHLELYQGDKKLIDQEFVME